jgi:hypothetical protein
MGLVVPGCCLLAGGAGEAPRPRARAHAARSSFFARPTSLSL